MQQSAHICDNDIVLDPSAGTGNLVNGLNIPKENIFLVEPNPEFCEFLRRSGYVNVIQSTFEDALDKRVLPNYISNIIPIHLLFLSFHICSHQVVYQY